MGEWWAVNLYPWLAWLVISLAVLAVILWVVRVAPRRESREDAEEMLRRRYIEGEIDEEEYERSLAELRRPT